MGLPAVTRTVLLLLLLLLLLLTVGDAAVPDADGEATNATALTATVLDEPVVGHASRTPDATEQRSHGPNSETAPAKKSPTRVISLAESINRSQKNALQEDPAVRKLRVQKARQQWKQALQEIKDLTVDFSRASSAASSKQPPANRYAEGLLNRWKLFLDDIEPSDIEIDVDDVSNRSVVSSSVTITPESARDRPRAMRRFEGFASWERMLQDWKEDVQEYIAKVEQENANNNYTMSTFGVSSILSKTPVDDNDNSIDGEDDASILVNRTVSALSAHRQNTVTLPAPLPAQPGEPVVPETDLADRSKNIWIVTTASLPWMTGTAVNPLLRAAHMTRGRNEAGGSVTLMLPWLERLQDQKTVYGQHQTFESPSEQEQYVRSWLRNEAKLVPESQELNIEWYNAWQNKAENSLYSMGDITALIPEEAADIMILEEPEHLNWYRAPGQSWTGKFKHVVGIIHTNYFVYAQEQPAAFIRAPAMRLLCSWMCRAHCHRIIKLSGTLGQFAPEKELVENVHGVRGSFLDVGEAIRPSLQKLDYSAYPVFAPDAEPKIYFIGKMLWTKGLGSLMELLKYAEESAGIQLKVDMYGGGPDKDAASRRAELLGVNLEFHGPIDHVKLGETHKIFINPSTSEVLCTTVAEALAMGKFVVLPSHPSNDFFAQFPNCLTYSDKEEFVGNLYYAMTHSPEPLTGEYAFALSWEAAIERLEASGSIPQKEADAMEEALNSNETGIEFRLPPLIEDEEERKRLGETLAKTRSRYRQFRSRLAVELEQNSVLPAPWRHRFIDELDKRLDLDIESILESPKLRLKLSPAELDQRLLELYNNMADGPSGDVFRIIGGGNDVALQNLYIKRQAKKERKRWNVQGLGTPSFLRRSGNDRALEDITPERLRTPSQWIGLALRRNLRPVSSTSSSKTMDELSVMQISDTTSSTSTSTNEVSGNLNGAGSDDRDKLVMSISTKSFGTRLQSSTFVKTTATHSFVPPRSPASSYRLLL